MKAEHLDEVEIEAAIDKLCVPNHQKIGKIAIEQPKEDDFGWDSMGTYLTQDD